MVLISLVGLNEMHKDFFADMHTNYKKTPVITIGTDAECSHFEAYYQFKQFQNLNRPTNNSTIMEKLCTMLELDINKIINSYERSIDKRKRILLVDDDAVFLWDMREILKEQYQVFVALSVTQAMTLIGKKKPDLCIIDYDMPVCNGKQMLEMLRSEKKFQNIPVIFLTGISDKAHVMEIVALKPEAYLLKPPVTSELLKIIKQLTSF